MFWAWATEHWFLAFTLVLAALNTVKVAVRSVARIFWRDRVIVERYTQGELPPDEDGDEDEDIETRVEVQHVAEPRSPGISVWSRIRDN